MFADLRSIANRYAYYYVIIYAYFEMAGIQRIQRPDPNRSLTSDTLSYENLASHAAPASPAAPSQVYVKHATQSPPIRL